MTNPIKYTLNQELSRTTTKQEYKAIQHWLREVAWITAKKLGWV